MIVFDGEYPNDNPDLWTRARADDAVEVIEIVEFADEDFAITDDDGLTPKTPEVSAPVDPFVTFVETLADVARDAGAERAADLIPLLLDEGEDASTDATRSTLGGESFVETARAWRRVLRGDTEDLSACGTTTLDEWAADVIARLLAAPTKVHQLRQELRRRGVAAFGLLAA